MPDRFEKIEWDEDRRVYSAAWPDVSSPSSVSRVRVTLRDANLYTVLGLADQPASGFTSPSSAPNAWFNVGPSRLGISNRTELYSLEFNADEDATGFKFASIIGLKVKQAGS